MCFVDETTKYSTCKITKVLKTYYFWSCINFASIINSLVFESNPIEQSCQYYSCACTMLYGSCTLVSLHLSYWLHSIRVGLLSKCTSTCKIHVWFHSQEGFYNNCVTGQVKHTGFFTNTLCLDHLHATTFCIFIPGKMGSPSTKSEGSK